MKKKFYVLGFTFFVGDVIKWGKFLAILAQVTWAWAQPLDRNISLKFSLETRLKSKSFEHLIGFLATGFWFISYDQKYTKLII